MVGRWGTEPYTSSKKLNWGWEFDLKYDSLPRLDFKGVFCMHITDPPVAQLAYKIEHQALLVTFLCKPAGIRTSHGLGLYGI